MKLLDPAAMNSETPGDATVGEGVVTAIHVWRREGGGITLVNDYAAAPCVSPLEAEEAIARACATAAPAIARHGDGRRAVLALPQSQLGMVSGVVTLDLDPGDEGRGAVELWRRNDRGELALADGWYAGLPRLEAITPHVKFPRRAGLPGCVWDDRFPRVLGALEDSKRFVRVAAAKAERLSVAVGVPWMSRPPELDAVLLLLSTSRSSLVRAAEVWAPDPANQMLRIVSADYGACVDLAAISRPLSLCPTEGIAGRVFDHAAALLTTDLMEVEFARGDRFGEYGFRAGLGLPITVGERLVACLNLYL